MKRYTPLALAAILMLGAAYPAFAEDGPKGPPHGPGKDRGAKMFEEADANKDGELTKKEMNDAHHKRIDKMFADLDADKNGTLSKAELDKGREKMRAEMKERLKEKRAQGDKADRPDDGPPPPPPEDGDKPE